MLILNYFPLLPYADPALLYACRLFALRMSWREISLSSSDMLMQKYINAKMINAHDQCATSMTSSEDKYLLFAFVLIILC